jgi:hypothetical protein
LTTPFLHRAPTSSRSALALQAIGNQQALVELDHYIVGHQDDWFVREVLGMMRRTFARLDVSSRSMFAIVTPGSCFAGTLLGWRSRRIVYTCCRPRKTSQPHR